MSDRVLALENKPSTGGAQTQDTGWITISENEALHDNVVKVRRINDMVHVSLSNPDYKGLLLELDSNENCVILANKEISKGFTPMKAIISPVLSTEDDVKANSNRTSNNGLAIFKVENNKVTLKVYSDDISSGSPTEMYINNFSYFTEDPFPTNLN